MTPKPEVSAKESNLTTMKVFDTYWVTFMTPSSLHVVENLSEIWHCKSTSQVEKTSGHILTPSHCVSQYFTIENIHLWSSKDL